MNNHVWIIEMLRVDCEARVCTVTLAKDGHWHMWTDQFRSERNGWSLTECIETWQLYRNDASGEGPGYKFEPHLHRIRNTITGETIPCAAL